MLAKSVQNESAARHLCFVFFAALLVAAFQSPLAALIRVTFQQENSSYICLIPFISTFLLIRERQTIFSQLETHWCAGSGLILFGTLLYAFGLRDFVTASTNDRLSVEIFAMIVTWFGGFVLCYGLRAFRMALFPALFLCLTVPLPDVVLNPVISWLQTGSAEVSYAGFQFVGVPVFRIGFLFSLPGVTIEVARECSGIHSSLALLITALLAGHLFLRTARTRIILILVAVPLLIVKNGIRIVTLALLSIYVDPSFLTGSLHHQGGIVFFLVALGFLAFALRSLQHLEGSAGPHAV